MSCETLGAMLTRSMSMSMSMLTLCVNMAPETIGYMALETIGYMASETTGFYMASIGKRTSRSNSGLFVRHSLTYASRSIEIPLLLSPT